MRSFGIHFRLLLAAFLLISATTLLMGYMGAGIIHDFVRTRFDERIEFLAEYVALNAELGVLIDDRRMLERLAENLLSEKDVIRVSLMDKNGEMLAHVSRSAPGSVSAVETPVVLKTSREESIAFGWAASEAEQRVIGTVRVEYSTGEIDALLRTLRTRFFWLSVVLGTGAVVLFYFISMSLVSPVTRLVEAVRRVSLGDLDSRVRPEGPPETRNLALAFNNMLDSLRESRDALEDAHQEMIRQQTLAELGKFSMMIAHEVKNPLSIIKSSLDILKKDTGLTSEVTLVGYMEDEILRLNRLIEEFLLFARPARPNRREVDVHELLMQHLDRVRSANPEVGLDTQIPSSPCNIIADPDLLTRAIGNVIKNGIEAGEGKGRLCITAQQDRKEWSLWIRDDGPGIDGKDIEKIFEPFYTTRAKGTGLGLAFAAQVLHAHGGRIMAENHDTGGALFSIRIPIGFPESGKIKVSDRAGHFPGKLFHSDNIDGEHAENTDRR